MADWIRKRERHEETQYRLFFQLRGATEGTGKIFDCDAGGGVLEPGHVALVAALRHDPAYESARLVEFEHAWTVPAAIRCACGAEVELGHFTNTCECGRDFNMSGDELAPREQWGEETGEHWTECI